MDTIRFFFWEAFKALSLALVGLVAAKAVGRLEGEGREGNAARLKWVRGFLYAVILALVALGGRSIGLDLAAEFYIRASNDNLARGEIPKAYSNALRAVELRPGILRYWRTLAQTKLATGQFASLLADLDAFRSLDGGKVDEQDTYRFAVCHYSLGRYDQVIALTQGLINQNRWYAPPYILQGMAYCAQRKFPEAEKAFQEVLQLFPGHQAAVEGLAHVYFLAGDRAGAAWVLDETARFAFPAEVRKRFEALKALYAQ